MNTELKPTALIGVGRWGRKILGVLTTLSRVKYAVHNNSIETIAYLSNTYPDLQSVNDFHLALADPDVEDVFIATPIETHFTIAKESLSDGKNTFVEKPLSGKRSEVDELYAMAEKNNCRLSTGYIHLHDETLEVLSTKIASQSDMKLKMVWRKFGTFDSPIVTNLLVHDLAITFKLLGDCEELHVIKREEDLVQVEVRCERGTSDIFIDRRSSQKIKELTLDTLSERYKIVGGELTCDGKVVLQRNVDLLKQEVRNFLANSSLSDTREIDEMIAVALEKID